MTSADDKLFLRLNGVVEALKRSEHLAVRYYHYLALSNVNTFLILTLKIKPAILIDKGSF